MKKFAIAALTLISLAEGAAAQTSDPTAPDDPYFFILAKAAIISLKYELSGPPISFEFTPELDDRFRSYVRDTGWFQEAEMTAFASSGTPAETYSKIAYLVASRAPEFMRRFNARCTPLPADVRTCELTKFDDGPDGNQTERLIANFLSDSDFNFIVDLNDGVQTITRTVPGEVVMHGRCTYEGRRCEMNGFGVMTADDERQFTGLFKDGSPTGIGTIEFLKTDEVYQVRVLPDSYETIRRLK